MIRWIKSLFCKHRWIELRHPYGYHQGYACDKCWNYKLSKSEEP